jgi:long-chain acyl-CoA synthetase
MVLAGAFMRAHLATFLDDFRRHGRQIAVVHYRGNRRRAATYEEIARQAGCFATLLVERGIVAGDRVLLWAENGSEWMAAFYGCMLRGVLAVPLDALGSAEFAARIAADVTPKLVVGDENLLNQLLPEWPRLSFEDWAEALPAEETGAIAGLSHETPLQILFTSGTTGDPKGVVLTHGNVLASVEPIEKGAQPYLRYEKPFHPLRFLHTLPLSHVFGQTMGLWVPPIFAAQVHFESRLVAPRLIEIIRRERISVLAAVPRVHALLKSHLEATYPGLDEQLAASTGIRAWKRWWRFRRIHAAFGFKFWALISGGGALSASVEQFWNALGFVVVQGYGMTETTALITLNHPFHVARGSIGKPLPGREVKLGADGEVLVRGAMISSATWSGGAMHARGDEWLATGDLAESQPSGDFRFVGRKSEVIVTSAGVNLHPEDLEAAIEQEPGVAACAVVAIETPSGPEPCAVLAFRGAGDEAPAVIERANSRLAEFQRLRRWVLWPEPDLPRTSTGKIRRKPVAEWLAGVQAAASNSGAAAAAGSLAHAQDWLLAMIEQITGETPPGVGDELRLTEDLQLDSLGRVQLAAALEERLGIVSANGLLEQVQTLEDLRSLLAAKPGELAASLPAVSTSEGGPGAREPVRTTSAPPEEKTPGAAALPVQFHYPHWPWSKPVCLLRTAFIEAVMRPLVWLLAGPAVKASPLPPAGEPMLIIANHVTAYDGALIQYALPGAIRRRIAAAMAGEMLEDYRHFRNPERSTASRGFFLIGPLFYGLLTALFNVFPLPRQQGFQRSFAHAGEALDRGFNVMIFPEGTRSAAGQLARFRQGIGLLVKQSGATVLPIALRGLGEIKAEQKKWFRSGRIEIRVGQPIRFSAFESEAEITARLHAEVEKLLS